MDPGASPAPATADALTRVVREETGRLTATLVRLLGDFDAAEDLVQDALVAALEHWPREGIPARPGAWLLTTARRRAVDRWRREARYADRLARLARVRVPDPAAPDDELRLLFLCCHPALAREAQVALTLRAACGLTTAAIARAFLTSEATVAQRIVRAKRKIVAAGIPWRVPGPDDRAARLEQVLAVLYLLFNEGYLASEGPAATRPDLAETAAWLTARLARLLPDEPEVAGLRALIRLHQARAATRFDASGGLVLLRDQDRARWDHAAIAAAAADVVALAAARRPGPYQIQAAIAACHGEAPSWEATDWAQIFLLYHALYARQPTPVVRLNRAIALGYVAGPGPALAELDTLAPALDGYHLYHATRAALLRAQGDAAGARAADARALALTANPAERALLTTRLFPPDPPP